MADHEATSAEDAEANLEELARAAGKDVGEFMSDVKEAAAQAGVYLEDKSLKDLSEQLIERAPEAMAEGQVQLYNTLTNSSTWATATENLQRIAREAGEDTHNIIDGVARNISEIDLAEIGEAYVDGAEYAVTTDLGQIWDDLQATDVYQSFGAFRSGLQSELSNGGTLKDEFSGPAAPQLPPELSQKIEAEAKADGDNAQPTSEGPKADEPDPMGPFGP